MAPWLRGRLLSQAKRFLQTLSWFKLTEKNLCPRGHSRGSRESSAFEGKEEKTNKQKQKRATSQGQTENKKRHTLRVGSEATREGLRKDSARLGSRPEQDPHTPGRPEQERYTREQ